MLDFNEAVSIIELQRTLNACKTYFAAFHIFKNELNNNNNNNNNNNKKQQQPQQQQQQ